MNAEVHEFTRRALDKGVSREEIAEVLRQAGWSPAHVKSALNAFATIDFQVAVPRPRPYLSARDVFIYALFFTTLYVSVYNLGALAFHLIDLALPDPASGSLNFVNANQRTFIDDGIRRNIAAVIIAFPLFVFLLRLTTRAMIEDPTRRQSPPRRWLTYLTLFIAAAALIRDFSTLVYKLLGGELPTRFLFKIATILFIAGGTFIYFMIDIRRDEQS